MEKFPHTYLSDVRELSRELQQHVSAVQQRLQEQVQELIPYHLMHMSAGLKNRIKIQRELQEFQQVIRQHFDPLAKKYIEEALELMLCVHGEQADRPDGQPYVIHPLQVADDLMRLFGIFDRDMVIAALLHDTIEDQPAHVVTYWEEKRGLRVAAEARSPELLETTAYSVLNSFFGERVQHLVEKLTHHAPIDGQTKEKAYAAYVAGLQDIPDAFAIKLADFHRNALMTRTITDPERLARAQQKYGPVVQETVLPFLQMLDESHPLYSFKQVLLPKAEQYVEEVTSKST